MSLLYVTASEPWLRRDHYIFKSSNQSKSKSACPQHRRTVQRVGLIPQLCPQSKTSGNMSTTRRRRRYVVQTPTQCLSPFNGISQLTYLLDIPPRSGFGFAQWWLKIEHPWKASIRSSRADERSQSKQYRCYNAVAPERGRPGRHPKQLD